MRPTALLFAALLPFALPTRAAEPAPDPALEAALERTGELEAAERHAEIPAELEPWAEAGNPEVDYTLAYALFELEMDGRRVEDAADADLAKVERYAERAAAAGHAGAANLLYMLWGNGYGRPVDMPKAMQWLEKAVAGGDIGAQVNYAVMLYEGRPWLARDRERACRMFADFGDVEGAGAYSLYYLGLATMRGECGFDEDAAKAADFIGRAAEGGVRDAERDFGQMHEQGLGVDKDIAEALRWYERAGEHGDGYALWRLGMAHVEGNGRDVDPARAVDYFERAIANDSSNAMVSMAVMYATGSGVEKDPAQALAMYRRAADAGEAHAYRGLAVMALNGEGRAADPVEALALYEKGIELGNAEEPALRREIENALAGGREKVLGKGTQTKAH